MRDILIIANFASALDGTDNNRFSYLAARLSEFAGVELLTSDYEHSGKMHRPVDRDYSRFPFQLTFLHEPGYPSNICPQRFFSHFLWGVRVLRALRKRRKPDVIYCAMPSLTAAFLTARWCKKNKVRFVVDVQDLWPEAFAMAFHVPILSDILFLPFRRLANTAYRQADEIVAVSQTYVDRVLAVNKKRATGHSVFLGTRLSDFDENVRACPPPQKPAGEIRLAYCGSLGKSYDIPCVLDALAIVRESGVRPPVFQVMGDGERRTEFEAYAKQLGLKVHFWGSLPYKEMCGVLCSCDMTVNPIIHSPASIINKHADYAACGLPVLNTQDSPEYRALVDRYAMGLNSANGDAKELAQNMIRLLENEDLRKQMGENARRCAEACFDRERSYQEIISLLI